MICPNCTNECDDGENFCPKCGGALNECERRSEPSNAWNEIIKPKTQPVEVAVKKYTFDYIIKGFCSGDIGIIGTMITSILVCVFLFMPWISISLDFGSDSTTLFSSMTYKIYGSVGTLASYTWFASVVNVVLSVGATLAVTALVVFFVMMIRENKNRYKYGQIAALYIAGFSLVAIALSYIAAVVIGLEYSQYGYHVTIVANGWSYAVLFLSLLAAFVFIPMLDTDIKLRIGKK